MSASKRITGVHYDAIYERHDTGPHHPESAHRYAVLRKALEGLPESIIRLPRRTAEVLELLLVHEHYYHDLVYQDVESFAHKLRTGDTAICEESYDIAREACGAVLLATSLVADLQLIIAAAVWGFAAHVSGAGLDAPVVGSIVSLSGGAMLANVISVVLLIIETTNVRR